jgi:hypothetical protein
MGLTSNQSKSIGCKLGSRPARKRWIVCQIVWKPPEKKSGRWRVKRQKYNEASVVSVSYFTQVKTDQKLVQFKLVYIFVGGVLAFLFSMTMMNLFTTPASKLRSSLPKASGFDIPTSAFNENILEMQTSPPLDLKEPLPLIEPREGLESWMDYLSAQSEEASKTTEVEVGTETPSLDKDDPRLRLFDEL